MSDRMMFKHPGPHEAHGISVDYVVVDDSEIDIKIAEGWDLDPTSAKHRHEAITENQSLKEQLQELQNPTAEVTSVAEPKVATPWGKKKVK